MDNLAKKSRTKADFDAIVIGAGFGGIYMLHKLRNELGLKVRSFEKGGGIGGTWYFNRYPGAKSDTEGFVYRYSFDKELLQEWDWTTRYLEQSEIEQYLNHVVDRFDLRRDIQLNTEVTGAVFDEQRKLWQVRVSTGEAFTSRYLVTALGLLAKSNIPNIPGRDSFGGTLVHTNAWPRDLDITGERVGVIGTGSTGTQFIVAAAKQAGHLTVFQRSPQYCVPSGNGPVEPAEVAETKKNFDAIWQQVRNSVVAFGFQESGVEAMSVSEQERRRVFQENWDKGNGFRFMFGTFCDIATNPEANAAAAAFIRSKIKEIVKDPETARKLTPTGLYAKRPLCNEGYYESFNRDNVTLVSIEENAIECDHARRGAHDRWRRAQARCAGLRHRLRRGRRQLPVDGPARSRRAAHQRGLGRRAQQLPGPVHARLSQPVHDPRPERPVHQPAAEHRVAGGLDQ